jgi:hypothetical protein
VNDQRRVKHNCVKSFKQLESQQGNWVSGGLKNEPWTIHFKIIDANLARMLRLGESLRRTQRGAPHGKTGSSSGSSTSAQTGL